MKAMEDNEAREDTSVDKHEMMRRIRICFLVALSFPHLSLVRVYAALPREHYNPLEPLLVFCCHCLYSGVPGRRIDILEMVWIGLKMYY